MEWEEGIIKLKSPVLKGCEIGVHVYIDSINPIYTKHPNQFSFFCKEFHVQNTKSVHQAGGVHKKSNVLMLQGGNYGCAREKHGGHRV